MEDDPLSRREKKGDKAQRFRLIRRASSSKRRNFIKQRTLAIESKNALDTHRARTDWFRNTRPAVINETLLPCAMPTELIRLICVYAREVYFFILDEEGWLSQWTILPTNAVVETARVYTFPGKWIRGNFPNRVLVTADYVVTETSRKHTRVWDRDTLEYLYSWRFSPSIVRYSSENNVQLRDSTMNIKTGEFEKFRLPLLPKMQIKLPPLNASIDVAERYAFQFFYNGGETEHDFSEPDGGWWKLTSFVLVQDQFLVFAVTDYHHCSPNAYQGGIFVFDCHKRDFIEKKTLSDMLPFCARDRYEVEHFITYFPEIQTLVSVLGDLLTLIQWPTLTLLRQTRLSPPFCYAGMLAGGEGDKYCLSC